MSKLKRSTALFLCLLTFLISFPITAHADYTFASDPQVTEVQATYYTGDLVSYYPVHEETKNIPFALVDQTAIGISKISLNFVLTLNLSSLNENDGLSFTYTCFPSTASVKSWKLMVWCSETGEVVSEESTTDYCTVTFEDIGYYAEGNTYPYHFYFSVYYNEVTDTFLRVGCNHLNVYVTDSTKGLLQTILEWLQNIRDKIVGLPSAIGEFITNLKDNIGSWFSDLKDNLRQRFDDVGQWFSDLRDNISSFFTSLGDRISGFFTSLFNKLWWGNEQGESAYQEPVFSSDLLDVLNRLDDYYVKLEDTKVQIDSSRVEISTYIEDGTSFIDKIFGVFPSMLIALVTFGVVFVFARKVVGR